MRKLGHPILFNLIPHAPDFEVETEVDDVPPCVATVPVSVEGVVG